MQETPLSPIEYFRLKSFQSESRASIGNMNRAIDAFSRFIEGTTLSFHSFDDALLGEWAANQFFEGYYAKTVAYNISKIAALYNKAVTEGLAPQTNSFSNILKKIQHVPIFNEGKNRSSNFRLVRDIFISDLSNSYEKQLAKDILIFGLLNGGLPLSSIINYKKDEYSGDDSELLKIVDRYSKPKNKYLFPLRQGKTTLKKIARSIQLLIANLLYPTGNFPISEDPEFIITDLWCDIAMNLGFTASDIKTCIASTGASNFITCCAQSSDIDDEKIAWIRRQVSESLTHNPVRWYAMHLRNRSELKDLTDRLSEKQISLQEIYYPMEDIIRKVGKKKIFEHKPVISWLVFYRAKASQLKDLFRQIGDIAWGYRYINDVRSPYAVFADSEIAKYQLAIGTLSPSTVLTPDQDIKLQKGDKVVILGGPMSGHQGTLIAEKQTDQDAPSPERNIYRIRLSGGNFINWVVDCDPRMLKKL